MLWCKGWGTHGSEADKIIDPLIFFLAYLDVVVYIIYIINSLTFSEKEGKRQKRNRRSANNAADCPVQPKRGSINNSTGG